MFCAISGEPPKVPVVSRKSGLVYEQRLIQKYIDENGKDPVTGDSLELDDLIEIKASKYQNHIAEQARLDACAPRHRMKLLSQNYISTRSC